MTDSTEKLLAIHPGALGDLVLFGRLLERLGGRATLIARGGPGRLLRGLGVVEKAVDFDALPMHELFADGPEAGGALAGRLAGFDRLVSCFGESGSPASMRLSAVCGARRAAFLPVRPPEGFGGHLLGLWEDLLGLGPEAGPMGAWRAPRIWRERAYDVLARAGLDPDDPFVLIHPGSGGAAKCYSPRGFMTAAWLIERQRVCGARRCVFVLGPVERERGGEGLFEQIASSFPVPDPMELETLAGLLDVAAGYIGNDSGVSHLAAALGARTVALFGPTRPEQFAPLGPRVKTLHAPATDDIPTGDIVEALDELFGGRASGR